MLRTEGWDEATLWAHFEASLGAEILAPRRELLAAQLDALRQGFDFADQIELIEREFEPSHVL